MSTLLYRLRSRDPALDALAQGPITGHSHVDGVPEELAIEIDANGSPVTFKEASWLICFVPGLRRQWWHRFANSRHKHVFALRAVGDGTWLIVEPWWTRLMVNVLTHDEAIKFLRWGGVGDILKVRESVPGRGSQVRGWSNCSVLMSFLLGRSYWTWTPNGLYRRLVREPDTERVDLSQFLRKHVQLVTSRNVNAVIRPLPRRQDEPLDEALLVLGTAVMAAMTSESAIGLYKAVVSESSRFTEASGLFWARGPGRAIARIREALEDARCRGEVEIDDSEIAARQFMAMLRGNLHLEIVFGVRAAPSPNEVRGHVRSVVSVFLRGAAPKGVLPDMGDGRNSSRHSGMAEAGDFSSDLPSTQALTDAGLIWEIGESAREIVHGDDWQEAANWAEDIWRGYSECTGLSWEQASARIHEVWKASAGRDAQGKLERSQDRTLMQA